MPRAPAAKSKASQRGKREMVKRPLEPSTLSEMGALDDVALPAGPFDPAGNWTHAYRIWTCYGYRSGSNRDQGSLTIRRTRGPDGEDFRLSVGQSVRMDPKNEQDVHHVAAEIRCRSDALASPALWTFSSRFTRGPEQEPLPELDHAEEARRMGESLEVRIGEQTFRREASGQWTADWCLFEALQRLPFGPADALEFDLLEGLTAWKPGQRLSYRGKIPVTWGGQAVGQHCFQQWGTGVWPYEYWLDEEHRLLLAITGARIYIWQPGQGGEQ